MTAPMTDSSPMTTHVVEIRAAEGGEDARLFARDLLDAYRRLAERLG